MTNRASECTLQSAAVPLPAEMPDYQPYQSVVADRTQQWLAKASLAELEERLDYYKSQEASTHSPRDVEYRTKLIAMLRKEIARR